MNLQLAEKQELGDGYTLDVHSIFRTLQGEGPLSGRPSTFIRLAGCDIQCPSCDTQYTEGRATLAVELIIDQVNRVMPKHGIVVITGGEPFRQNITPLVRKILNEGIVVQIETNGTLHVPEFPFWSTMLHTVISPKTGSINQKFLKDATTWPGNRPYLKYVMSAGEVDSDGLPLRSLGEPSRPWRPDDLETWVRRGRVYLSPCDEQDSVANDLNVKACIDSCMRNGYILSLQQHKIIGVP